jgi:Flp pilus assembly protein TadD
MPSLLSRYLTTLGILTAITSGQVSANSMTESAAPSFKYNTLYSLLLAEMALARNQAPIALNEYRQQAVSTLDNGITERALQIANYLQDSKTALSLAEQWAKSSPDNSKMLYQLAYHSLKQQKYDTAIQAIDKLLILEPEAELEALFLGALPANANGRKQLLAELTNLEKNYPDNSHLLFIHGLLVGENGDYPQALRYMEQARAKNPRSIPIILLEARILTLSKQEKKAASFLEAALVDNPQSQQLNLNYARALIAIKDYQTAEKKISQLIAIAPNNPETQLMHALLAYDNKHDEAAIVSFNRLIELQSNEEEAYFYLAMIAKRQEKLADAEKYLSQITDGDRFLSAQIELATLRIKSDRLNQARQQLAESRQQHPEIASTLYAVEIELLNNNHFEETAYLLALEALKQFPNDNLLLFSRALMADKRQELAQFELDMRELLKRDPNNPSYMNAFGYTLADKTDRLAEAEPYLRRAFQLKPNDPAIIDSIGWLLYKQGHLFEALTYIKQAFIASNNDEEIGLHLAEILWVSGYKADAKKTWQQLLSKKPNSEPVLKHRALWEK